MSPLAEINSSLLVLVWDEKEILLYEKILRQAIMVNGVPWKIHWPKTLGPAALWFLALEPP